MKKIIKYLIPIGFIATGIFIRFQEIVERIKPELLEQTGKMYSSDILKTFEKRYYLLKESNILIGIGLSIFLLIISLYFFKKLKRKNPSCLGCGSSFIEKGSELCSNCLAKNPSDRNQPFDWMKWRCPICGKQGKESKEIVPAFKSEKSSSWFGRAHRKCMKEYNKTHENKYQVRKYSWHGKFLGHEEP